MLDVGGSGGGGEVDDGAYNLLDERVRVVDTGQIVQSSGIAQDNTEC